MQSYRSEDPLVVFCVGLGAVTTTLIAGIENIRHGLGTPIGSITELGTRYADPTRRIKDALPMTALDALRWAAWDPIPDNGFIAAVKAGVLSQNHLNNAEMTLRNVRPLPAVFSADVTPRLTGTTNVKSFGSWLDAANQLREDIRRELALRTLRPGATSRGVLIWCASTEGATIPDPFMTPQPCHETLAAFEAELALRDGEEGARSPWILPSMVYAYAALMEGIPVINGSPNAMTIPALVELAERERVPIAGNDLKTGQTLVKTTLAPMFAMRMLGVDGWFSTNILGNRDGEVLADPKAFAAKERTKTGVLSGILDATRHPELYRDVDHVVRINYYKPRGDAKEGWDNIDLVGWMGYPMQLKVNFLCRDSILAAPLVLDLIRWMTLAHVHGMYGLQEWLAFYFKAPAFYAGHDVEHDIFQQWQMLHATIHVLIQRSPTVN